MKYGILLLSVFLSYCSAEHPRVVDDHDSELVKITVDVEKTDTLRMSEYFSNITYHHLKTPNNEPIGRIFKILIQDNHVALYDRSKKSVWIFTKSGEYVNEVKIPQGRGVGELENISDVYFDNENRIHALGSFELLMLDMEGNLIEEISLDFFGYRFTYYENTGNYFAYSGTFNTRIPDQFQGYDLYKFNMRGQVIGSYIPQVENKLGLDFGVPNSFPVYRGVYYYFQHLNDTVYYIGENDLKPAYVFEFGDQALPEEIFERRKKYGTEFWQWSDFWENEIDPYDYITHKTNFEVTDRYIHSRLGSAESNYMILYDREKKTTHIGKDKFVNDIDYGPSPYIYLSSDESLYSYVEANDMLRHLNELYNNDREKYFSREVEQLRRIADSMRENSNPILMRLDFNE
ncbi:MAG: 6-bladed beta-propeller [Balneolaceae bacterium]|nr:6-bladed beta-propeller [Balneolaceae bacterium]